MPASATRKITNPSLFDTDAADADDDGPEGMDDNTISNILAYIKEQQEVINTVRLQPIPIAQKLKIQSRARRYVQKHEGSLRKSQGVTETIKQAISSANKKFDTFLVSAMPWEERIKRIEGYQGSVVASYFIFLRWIIWVNVWLSILPLSFIIIPEMIAGKTEIRIPEEMKDTEADLQTLWDAEGVIEYSPIFYGFFTNDRKIGIGYPLPLAYLLTTFVTFVFSFAVVLRKMAANARQNRMADKDEHFTFGWKLFGSWDFGITNKDTAIKKHKSVGTDFKETIREEQEKSKEMNRYKLLALRITGNILVLMLLALSAWIVQMCVQRSRDLEKKKLSSDYIPSFWEDNELTLVMTLISTIFPNFFDLISLMEKYHPRTSLRWQLARIFVLNLLNLYTLFIALFWKQQDMAASFEALGNSTVCVQQTTTAEAGIKEFSKRTTMTNNMTTESPFVVNFTTEPSNTLQPGVTNCVASGTMNGTSLSLALCWETSIGQECVIQFLITERTAIVKTAIEEQTIQPYKMLLFPLLVTVGLLRLSTAEIVSARTRVGIIDGVVGVANISGETRQYVKFMGIPYAEPPVGQLRFRKPLPKVPFGRMAASEPGPPCPQNIYLSPDKTIKNYSEDCLSLNVYVPYNGSNLNIKSRYPVMIWIHGGGFIMGTSRYYSGHILSAFNDVIVVTINYRLSIFGFLSTGDAAAFGNYGLWDQRLAIRWVHDNIAAFGGNVNNITLFGESAGSSAVLYQAIYPSNKGLFKRVIGESGTPLATWAFTENSKAHQAVLRQVSQALGCSQVQHMALVDCLRSKSMTNIMNALYFQSADSLRLNFGPVVDGEFLEISPELIFQGKHEKSAKPLEFFNSLDIMIGANNMDGALSIPTWEIALNRTGNPGLEYGCPRYVLDHVIIPLIVRNLFYQNISVVEDAMRKVYGGWGNTSDVYSTRDELMELSSDFNFFAPINRVLKSRDTNSSSASSYLYIFSYRPTSDQGYSPPWVKGANHLVELPFVFGFPGTISQAVGSYVPLPSTPEEQNLSRTLMSMWSNFAKSGLEHITVYYELVTATCSRTCGNGYRKCDQHIGELQHSNPNSPDTPSMPITWPRYELVYQQYMEFTLTLSSQSIKQRLAADRMDFWLKVLPDLLKSTGIRNLPTNAGFNPNSRLELFKLTLMDLVFTIGFVILQDFLRGVIVRYCNRMCCWDLEKTFPEYADFQTADNLLHLINNQGMIWCGTFFSPGLPLLNMFKLLLLLYLRSWTVTVCNVPQEGIFKASRSNNFYYALLLIMLFLCMLPPLFAIVAIEPSPDCGPFSGQEKMYDVLTDMIRNELPETVTVVLGYVASPGVIIPTLLLFIMTIYYLIVVSRALKGANQDLKKELEYERTEGKKKVYAMADAKRETEGGSVGAGGMSAAVTSVLAAKKMAKKLSFNAMKKRDPVKKPEPPRKNKVSDSSLNVITTETQHLQVPQQNISLEIDDTVQLPEVSKQASRRLPLNPRVVLAAAATAARQCNDDVSGDPSVSPPIAVVHGNRSDVGPTAGDSEIQEGAGVNPSQIVLNMPAPNESNTTPGRTEDISGAGNRRIRNLLQQWRRREDH